jgi:hypothetical protein
MLTFELRQQLRHEVDKAARAQHAEAHAKRTIRTCKNCHGLADNYTDGCPTCWNRKANRKRRANPEWRERDNERVRQRRKKTPLRTTQTPPNHT